MGLIRERIAIDLGTAYSIVAHEKSDELWRIPSSIALDSRTKEPVAYGEQAKMMFGIGSQRHEVIRPLKEGVICNFEAAGHYLSYLVSRARRNPLALQYQVLVCVPWGATAVETKSYIDRIQSFRTQIRIVREPFAAALGSDLDVFSSEGCTLIDIGGGTVEISTIAHGHMIFCSTLRSAGNAMDQLLIEKLLRNKFFEVGENTAEEIKINYGSVFLEEGQTEKEFEVRGLDRKTSCPGRMSLSTETLRDYLEPLSLAIENKLKEHLRHLPPESQLNVEEKGVFLVGGGALLKGWSRRLNQRLGIKITIPSDPHLAVIRGMKKILREPAKYESILKISEGV